MRILVLTNHFAEFAGSETVALEVAEWFRDRGDEVSIAANYVGMPLAAEAHGIDLTDQVEAVLLETFDLVWCQHDLLSLIPYHALARFAEARTVPHVAMVSLSPVEPYEHLNLPLARALSAELFANSPETRAEMMRRNFGEVAEDEFTVFHNACPIAFHEARRSFVAESLNGITVVSNHPPRELLSAIEMLSKQGVSTRIFGQNRNWKRLTPQDLVETSAIVTIGKTVVYGLALGLPVYVYDVYGGDGWLTAENFSRNLERNFSGRPSYRRMKPVDLAREIIEGYSMAAAAARDGTIAGNMSVFKLGTYLEGLRQRALARPVEKIAAHLEAWLRAPGTRGLHEALRHKSIVMKRSYVALQRPS